MAESSSTYEITLEARLDNLPLFRDFVARSCRTSTVDEATCYDIKLAVDEACTNIITPGYKDSPPGAITLIFRRDTDRIVIKIMDDA